MTSGDDGMFQVSQYIIYGNYGVCCIQNVGQMEGEMEQRLYYTLTPCYMSGTISTPVDNQRVVMRPIMTADEAMALISHMQAIDTMWIQDEKRREQDYKTILKTCDCKELVKMIKTIYLRKQARIQEGKRLGALDEKYFNMAEEKLYGEMAISLQKSKEETKTFVHEQVEALLVTS